MKKALLSKLIIVGILIMAMVGTFALNASAADDNYGYYLILYGNHANDYLSDSEMKYRQTKSVDNEWKVGVAYNTEGDGTIATFWLANEDYERVSDTEDVKQGTGAHYYKPFSSANQTNIRLGVENNNNTGVSNTVSGVWDEETW